MLIGTRISPEWLGRPEDLRFLAQVGVDVVDITMDLIPGYRDSGRLGRDGLRQAVDTLADAGLRIERINSTGDQTLATFLGRDGSQRELDNLAHNAQLCAEFGLPVLGVQCFQASTFGHVPMPSHSWVEGRGGYQYLHCDLSAAIAPRPAPAGAPTHEQLWERTVRIFRTILPICESGGVLAAMHGNDPPVPALWGVPQILCDLGAALSRRLRSLDGAGSYGHRWRRIGA